MIFAAQVELKQMLRKANHLDADVAAATEEVAADYAGRLMSDGDTMEQFIQQNQHRPSLLKRMAEAFRELWRKLTGKERTQAEEAAYRLEKAYEKAVKEAKKGGKVDGAKSDSNNNHSRESVNQYANRSLTNDAEIYSYSFLTNLPDMNTTTLPDIKTIQDEAGRVFPAAAVKDGMKNARSVGTERDGKVYVKNAYTGRELRIDVASIRHGLSGTGNRILTNARLGAVIGNVVQNAVPINALKNKAEGVTGTYVMAAYAVDNAGREIVAIVTVEQRSGTVSEIEAYDVTHAVSGRQKRSAQVDTKSQGVYPSMHASKIKIADFLEVVKSTHQSVLSDDVLNKLGIERNPFGFYTNQVRFSLRQPAEEVGDLVAIHNANEDGLLSALELGGLPMPSIAVVKAADGHSKYGSISLVFNKSTIDPQADSRNKVYGGDAWTPTAPRVEYQVNSETATTFENEMYRLSGNNSVANGIFRNSSVLRSAGIDDVSTMNITELAKKLADTDTVRAAYLADQGKTLEALKKDKVWDTHGNDTLQKVIDRIGVQELAGIVADLETGESAESALGDHGETIRDILREYYRKKREPLIRRMAEKRHWTNAEIEENRNRKVAQSMENTTVYTLEDIVRHAWEMYEGGGATEGEVDRLSTSDALRKAVNDSDVEKWVAQKLNGVLGEAGIYNGKDRYTASGNRKSFSQLHYAYTLENIVKAMKETQQQRGENTWGVSAKTLQAVATPDYRNIQEIKADSGRLRLAENAEYDANAQAIDEQINEIISEVKQKNEAHSYNSFIESDIIGEVLMSAAKGKKTVDAIVKAFSKEGYKISSQTAQKIQSVFKAAAEMPTGYFEAKPQRAVGFDEVLAAIVPNNSSSQLLERLEDAGVQILEYEAGNEADRLAKLNSVENSRFSLRADAELEAAVQEIQQKREAGEISAEEAREQITELAQRAAEDNPDFAAIQKENEKLLRKVEQLKKQMKLTTAKDRSVRQTDTDRVANGLLKDFSSRANRSDIKQAVYALANKILRAKNTADIWESATVDAQAILWEVVENAAELNDTFAEEYRDIKQYLRSTPLVISETDSHDITDLAALKKSMRGTMRISVGENGNVDRIFTDMAARWPDFFNAEETTHPADMVERIADVMDMLKPAFENPFSANMEAAVQECANDLLETLVSDAVREEAPTFADRQKAKYKEEQATAIQRERDKRDKAVAKTKAEAKEKRTTAIQKERDRQAKAVAEEKDKRATAIQRERDRRDKAVAKTKAEAKEKRTTAIQKERDRQAKAVAEEKDKQATAIQRERDKRDKAVAKTKAEAKEKRTTAIQKERDRQAKAVAEEKDKRATAIQRERDKRDKAVAKTKAEAKEKLQKAIQKERDKRTEAVAKAKEAGERALQRRKQRQKQTETRAKIKRHVQSMSTRLLNPTNTKHVPTGLQASVAKLLDSINLDSGRDSKNRAQRVQAMAELKAAYQKVLQNNDGDLVVNPDLLGDDSQGFVGLFDRVIAMGDKSIYEMTQSELDTVWAVVRSMETAISNAGKALANQKAQTIRGMADSFAQDISQKRPKPQKITNALRQDMMNPYSFFHQFGETATSIWRELRDAQDTQTIRIQEIAEKVQNKISPQLMKQAQKTVHTFDLESGEKLTLTNAQVMNLYNLMQRQQAQDHLMKGCT